MTIRSVINCPCADNVEFELIWNGQGKWKSKNEEFGDCGRQIYLEFWCGSGGSSCFDLRLYVSFSDNRDGHHDPETLSPVSCVCNVSEAISIVFVAGSAGACCNQSEPEDDWSMTITEYQ